MAIAHHVVFCCYGFWLPNDPRGSWSNFTAKWELFLAGGKATKTDSRISVAGVLHDSRLRLKVKKQLQFPPVELTGKQALAVAHGFKKAVSEGGYGIFVCSILPEHVHLVLGEHGRNVGRIVAHLKTRARQALQIEEKWPVGTPVWADGYWKVFLDTPIDVQRAIDYVSANPEKEGKKRQNWSFVKPFDYRG
jgi:REP element-mobilizing transposase RayT